MRVEVTIPGEPQGQGRARFARMGRFVRAYDPKESRDWKATAQQHMVAALAGAKPLEGAVSCEIQASFTCPKSEHRKTAPRPLRWHAKAPDADNVAKIVMDAAKGVLWLDDCQVSRLQVVKFIAAQGQAPGVRLRVEPIITAPEVGQ